ncbi:MAG: hypothetical protein ABFS18_05410 [Thermodesulfobacteriota bacterium]
MVYHLPRLCLEGKSLVYGAILNTWLEGRLIIYGCPVHNDAVCYGRSLNFIHEPDESYSHCVTKEVLAKRFLKFFEELEIIENNGGMDYSRAKAKSELIKLQTKYNFTNPGWYTEFMLGILIIEYAKKA